MDSCDCIASINLSSNHHRGQMTILMRQAGLLVPGMYGPSKDEWLAFGEEAPE